MPDVSYRVPGVPPGPAAGISAFLPHYNRPAGGGAQAFKYAVVGFPGTRMIPAPTRSTTPSPDPGDKVRKGTSASSDAPDGIWPNKYYQGFIAEPPGAGMPVQYYSPTQPGLTTLLPVPANNLALGLRSDQARLSRRAVLQRVRQLPWWPKQYEAPGNNGAGNSG
jgi:hypothetical protein